MAKKSSVATRADVSGTDAIDFSARENLYKELYFEAFNNQAQYGRWILASLLAVNGGSLIAVANAGEAARPLFRACGEYLVWGLALALICGGLAWINFSCAMTLYGEAMLLAEKGEKLIVSRTKRWTIGITLWGTPALACMSLGFFLAAGYAALSIKEPTMFEGFLSRLADTFALSFG